MGGAPQPRTTGSTAIQFTQAARRLGAAARAAGLSVPAFRSPPRVAGAQRTLRRYPDGAVVSVTLRGRPFDEVIIDMIEGLVRVNRLDGDRATHLRRDLLHAVTDDPGAGGGVPSPQARMAERQTQAA